MAVGDVDIRRKPVQDPSDRIRVEEGHRTSHDPVKQLFVDQLRGRSAAQQEDHVHGDLKDAAAGSYRRVDAQVLGRLVNGGVFRARVGPTGWNRNLDNLQTLEKSVVASLVLKVFLLYLYILRLICLKLRS